MTIVRFQFQHKCAGLFSGKIIDIGSHNDPGGLKRAFGDRVITCDLQEWDPHCKVPINVDRYFHAGKDVWPFEDDFADLVIMGEVLEHLYPVEQVHALREAHRVAPNLCITVPEDWRVMDGPVETTGTPHITVCTEELLRGILRDTGWEIVEWEQHDYICIPKGYFIRAERA